MEQILTMEWIAITLTQWLKSIGLNHILGAIVFYWFYGIRRVRHDAAYDERVVVFSPSLLHQPSRRNNTSNRHQRSLKLMEQRVPESTVQERRRFLTAKKGNVKVAYDTLRNYVDWRIKHAVHKEEISRDSLVERDEDEWDWRVASVMAMEASRQPDEKPNGTSQAYNQNVVLPRVARTFCNRDEGSDCTDRDGSRILRIAPGRMDERIVPVATYALAIALYIDQKLEPDSMEKITVMIDARGGQGWRNLHAGKLLPFMKETFQLLLTMFPERLSRAIVYPVPTTLRWIWNVVKHYLDPDTAEKICLLTGPARIHSPPPNEAMAEYLDIFVAELLEDERLNAFIPEISLE